MELIPWGAFLRDYGADADVILLTEAIVGESRPELLALLLAATLLIRSFWNLMAVDPGFRPEQLVAARVAPPGFEEAEPAARHVFARRLLERLEGVGSIEAAAVANAMPFDVGLFGNSTDVEGAPPDSSGYVEAYLGVSADSFRTMGTAILEGRPFTASDHAERARVVIVSERLARRHWGDESPVGKRIRFGSDFRQPRYGGAQFPWFTVVGVAEDVRFGGVANEPAAMLYLPFEQYWDASSLRVMLRTAGDAASVAPQLRSVVASLDPLAAVSDVRTFEARLGDTVARPRFTAYLLAAFAAIAVFLAAVGVYGVLAYSMSRRIREIGMRVALGAHRGDVFGLLFRQGAGVILAGLALGLPLALGASRLLGGGLLYGVDPTSVEVLGDGVIALTLVGAAAVPLADLSRRAHRPDGVAAAAVRADQRQPSSGATYSRIDSMTCAL